MGFGDSAKYDKQKEDNTYRGPESGEYIVFTTGLRRVKTKNSGKVERKLEIIKGRALDGGKDVSKYDGKGFRVDMWWDLSKKYNENQLAFAIMACHGGKIPGRFVEDGAFADTDENLAAALGGRPFVINILSKPRIYKDKNGNKKSSLDIKVLEVRHLEEEEIEKLLGQDPELAERVRNTDDLIEEPADFSRPRSQDDDGNSSGFNNGSDDGFFDDDGPLPF